MAYVDGYVLCVPKKNLKAYVSVAQPDSAAIIPQTPEFLIRNCYDSRWDLVWEVL
jgi:uncharacterized protein YbaA (DUF1428 family)